jgi:hypothetical protein
VRHNLVRGGTVIINSVGEAGARVRASVRKLTLQEKAAARAELDRRLPTPKLPKGKSNFLKYVKRTLIVTGVVTALIVDGVFLNFDLTRCVCVVGIVLWLKNLLTDAIAEGIRKGRNS